MTGNLNYKAGAGSFLAGWRIMSNAEATRAAEYLARPADGFATAGTFAAAQSAVSPRSPGSAARADGARFGLP